MPGFGDTRQSRRQIFTLNETHTFGPSVVNEARLGFNRIHITFSPNLKANPLDFSINDVTQSLHYLLKMLEHMQRLDTERGAVEVSAADDGES